MKTNDIFKTIEAHVNKSGKDYLNIYESKFVKPKQPTVKK